MREELGSEKGLWGIVRRTERGVERPWPIARD